jgi:ribosome-associated protein
VRIPYPFRESELFFEFIRSSGPGGQNVNKVSTAVRLRVDVRHSTSLPEQIKKRLLVLAGKKVDTSGVLSIRAQRFRTQEANRRDALKRLERLVQKAGEIPRLRKPTKPPQSSRIGRLEQKRLRGDIKRNRKQIDTFDD